jgi:hypothetical protein
MGEAMEGGRNCPRQALVHELGTTPPEITERRRAERDLFFDGKWSQNGTMTEYTRLTSRRTPVWGSAKKVDVSEALRRAMDAPQDAPQKPAQPETAPPPPDIPKTDETPSQPPQGGFFLALLRWLFGGKFR